MTTVACPSSAHISQTLWTYIRQLLDRSSLVGVHSVLSYEGGFLSTLESSGRRCGGYGAGYFVEICLGIQYTGTCSMIRALICGPSSKICPNPVLPFTILIVFLVVCWCAVLACVANSMDLYQIAPRVQRSDRGSWCFPCHRSLLVQSTLCIH